VRIASNQIDDLYQEITRQVQSGHRVLVTTLTKRMAEELTDYYLNLDLKAKYMHSDIDTLERIEIVKGLREGAFDVLVGINLLREGLDLPEVALVAILDADKEGFLRSERSLVQTAGRAARNIDGLVIFYADRVTSSMERAINETNRRREKQKVYNKEHDITPQTIRKNIRDILASIYERDYADIAAEVKTSMGTISVRGIEQTIKKLEKKMKETAQDLRFEEAAKFRDEIKRLKKIQMAVE
jgi:excinuclease ABC subunit B